MFKRNRKVVTLLIDEDKCSGCGNCVVRCRRNVFSLLNDADHRYAIITSMIDCKGCGKCMKRCPSQAIYLKVE
ncbi:MAG: 4Fe-4S binding protein [Tannerellaceae bacterium]|nr:4Fe-4S binding protein [Tannerellaceae bacterium]MCD7915885.1 4Fe-4S binding protein [Tannerellaceae bacterium]